MLRNFRSAFAIGMMFVVPLLITGLIYLAFGGGGQRRAAGMPATQVLVVNQDTPPAGSPDFGSLLLDMLNDPSVTKLLQAAPAASEAEAIAAVNAQNAGVAVIVPPGFAQAILSGEGRPEVRILQDPTLTIGPDGRAQYGRHAGGRRFGRQDRPADQPAAQRCPGIEPGKCVRRAAAGLSELVHRVSARLVPQPSVGRGQPGADPDRRQPQPGQSI